MAELLKVSSSPHIFARDSIERIMVTVLVALAPAVVAAGYFFGLRALFIILLAVASCVATEALCKWLRGVPGTAKDFSAAVTGVLLAFNLPANAPWWMVVLGSVFAIAIVKELFGGLGYNIWNPALAARAFLLASWPTSMISSDKFPPPSGGTLSGLDLEALTQATPLQLIKNGVAPVLADKASYTAEQVAEAGRVLERISSGDYVQSLLWGNIGGVLGETAGVMLILGGVLLIVKGYIDWRVPVGYLGTVAVLAWVFGGPQGYFTGNVLFHVMGGGLLLGAFFMATDMVTTPVTPGGKWIFAIGCAVFTMLIRIKGGYPEGVSYAILLMNTATPLIDLYTKPRIYGKV
ncbi:MAG: RnfABCDGE type electron transport complex subunit D [Gemmatimonadota bacterium]|nr:RnfABCDGE type electron transport complex subunit D [Gemmatimonadota bacterium]